MNKRHKLFADTYLSNGFNGTQAYLTVYPKASYDTARVNSQKLLLNTAIKEYIEQQISQLVMGKNEFLVTLSKRARNEVDKEQMKALELIGKTLGAFTDKVEGNLNHNIISWPDFIGYPNP